MIIAGDATVLLKKKKGGPVMASEPVRDKNRDRVLEILRREHSISRVDIARKSGLQRSTISAIVDGLIKDGWVNEGPLLKTARGRRPTILTLNEALVVLVADIRPTQAVIALVDLNSRLLTRSVVPLIKDAEKGVDAIADQMLDLLRKFPQKICKGVGISLAGRVDIASKRLAIAPNLPWVGYDIQTALEKRLGLQVELDNAASACLRSELWLGHLEGIRNAVLITISDGIGAAVLADGRIIGGAQGFAGEVGHIPVSDTGPRCACGEIGCWEMFASSRAALRCFAEMSSNETAPTMQHLLNLEASGNLEAGTALDNQARSVGRGLRIVTMAYNPECILFVGAITLRWQKSAPLIEEELLKRMLSGTPPRLIALADGESARLSGAAATVLQRHTGFIRSSVARTRAKSASRRASLS